MISTKIIQEVVEISRQAVQGDNISRHGRKAIAAHMASMTGYAEAGQLAKVVLEQAILQGHACITGTGASRCDSTPNYKRLLTGAYAMAWPSMPSMSLKTSGKGENRTVTVVFSAKAEKTELEKLQDRINRLLSDLGATEAESESLGKRLLSVAERARVREENAKLAAKEQAEAAKEQAYAATLERAASTLAAHGIADADVVTATAAGLFEAKGIRPTEGQLVAVGLTLPVPVSVSASQS